MIKNVGRGLGLEELDVSVNYILIFLNTSLFLIYWGKALVLWYGTRKDSHSALEHRCPDLGSPRWSGYGCTLNILV